MKRQLIFIVSFFICLLLILIGIHVFKNPESEIKETSGYHITETNLLSPVKISKTPKPSAKAADDVPMESSASSVSSAPSESPLSESQIYSYLQGPKSWESRRAWSGKWGVTFYDGAKFGAFGCGLCCMANLYCSLTPYKCTPVDAYRFAKKHTAYVGGGAIDWGYMRDSLSMMGFSCKLQNKPKTYEQFQSMIASNIGTITLISSNESTCYWTNNPGHYVTIFLYDKDTDTVFLADSGVPEHNRKRISLKLIYRSLKTVSPFQFLSISNYDKGRDIWKHKSDEDSQVR